MASAAPSTFHVPQGYTMLTKLRGRKVIVLGGTQGIGFAVARGALEHQAVVVISSSSPARLQAALDRLRDLYPDAAAQGRIFGTTCDLLAADPDRAVAGLFEFAVAVGGQGPVHHVVVTAGDTIGFVPIGEATAAGVHGLMRTRYMGPVLVGKHAPRFLARDGSDISITFTGAHSGTKPVPGMALVSGLWTGLEGLVRGLALDLKPVRVNLVIVGIILTEGLRDSPLGRSQEALDALLRQTVTGRFGAAEDAAEGFLYFMKDRFATGQIVSTDGGRDLV